METSWTDAARSRPESLVARRSCYDTLRAPHYAEDLMTNPTQSPNVVDFSTYSNIQSIQEEASVMNSTQPLVYADQRNFDTLRKYNPQNECINWPAQNPTTLFSSSDHSNTQNARGLSLSLSSNPSSNVKDTKQRNRGFYKYSKQGGKECGKGLEDVTGIMTTLGNQWSSGPLGPFTGYATVLKSSKFLKPAQDLLDDICDLPGDEPIEMRILLQRIMEESGGDGGWSSSSINFATERQQKKATLFYMYDEVCRRYKHYYQQMQMVVSSFEAVAGLSAATPYVYLALKAVTKNFKCLKNAISEQLRNMKRSLVEDNSPSHHIGTSQMQSFQRRRSCLGVNTSFFDATSHAWRPQRGLPEQSVAILKAWLFEHFLHPYPTDHDKHMLASQTGLSRNQVSNWFINARVRLWKPMVEEIHELENKCMVERYQANNATNNPSEKHDIHGDQANQHNPNLPTGTATDELIGYSGIGLSGDPRDRQGILQVMEGSFGGLGAVSLSLGLRHNVGVSHQQQHSQRLGGGMMCRSVD